MASQKTSPSRRSQREHTCVGALRAGQDDGQLPLRLTVDRSDSDQFQFHCVSASVCACVFSSWCDMQRSSFTELCLQFKLFFSRWNSTISNSLLNAMSPLLTSGVLFCSNRPSRVIIMFHYPRLIWNKYFQGLSAMVVQGCRQHSSCNRNLCVYAVLHDNWNFQLMQQNKIRPSMPTHVSLRKLWTIHRPPSRVVVVYVLGFPP